MGVVAWFSCGAASAVAAKMAHEKYPNLRIVNNPVAEEHSDNQRFLKDIEEWIGVKIETAQNLSFPDNSANSVWKKRRYMNGIKGAPCTNLLKKEARRTWEDLNAWDGWHVFGFTVEEQHRHERRAASGMKLISPLIDAGMKKQDCFDVLNSAGIKLPAVYSIGSRFGSGYPNANCIGCVKATSATYWNHVRETFPDIFYARADLSREIGARLVRHDGKRIFLDELPPDAKGRSMKSMKIECGISCGKEEE